MVNSILAATPTRVISRLLPKARTTGVPSKSIVYELSVKSTGHRVTKPDSTASLPLRDREARWSSGSRHRMPASVSSR